MLGSLVLMAGLLAAQAEAKPAANDDLAPQVRKLVRQLDSAQLKQRDAAEEELIKLGSGVLNLLPQNVDPGKAEVAQRLARIRLKLQRSQAESSIQPSLVTLHGKMPLSKALAALQEQTGNKIIDVRREAVADVPDPEVSIDLEKAPFWQALDRVLSPTGLTVYPYGDNRAVQVVMQPDEDRSRSQHVWYSGPFRFEAVSVVAERDLRNPKNRALRLELEIAWEPRLAPIMFAQRLSDIKVVGDGGQALKVESQEAELEIPVESGPIAKKIVVPMSLPPRSVKEIGRLEGTIQVMLPGKEETFRFKDLEKAKDVSQRTAAVTVVLEQVAKNGKLWEFFVLARFDNAGGALASHRNWIFNNPAFVEGRDGKPINFDTMETTKQTENEVGLGYLFSLDGPLADYTFVYKTPATIFSVPLKYELKSIPLP